MNEGSKVAAEAKKRVAEAAQFRRRLRAHEKRMLHYWTLRAAYLRQRCHKLNQA
jgi:hypothetical protein